MSEKFFAIVQQGTPAAEFFNRVGDQPFNPKSAGIVFHATAEEIASLRKDVIWVNSGSESD